MFNVKTTISGNVMKNVDGEYKLTQQEIIIANDKIQNAIISNDLYLSFPHLYAEILLDNISIDIRYLKIEIDDNVSTKREWLFTVYKNSVVESTTHMNTTTKVYILKGLSLPLLHLNKREIRVYDKPSSEVIIDMFDSKDGDWNIQVDSKLNTSGLRWNRVNMTDLQFFNYLKDHTQLVNDYNFIPMFFLKSSFIQNKPIKTLKLLNYLSIEATDVSYDVNSDDIIFSSDTYNILPTSERKDYVHLTNGHFSTISGNSRKNYDNFNESILTEFVKSPNVIVNDIAKNKLKWIYRNSEDIRFPKMNDSKYLEMIEIGNVFSIRNYINNGVVDVSYFNIIGYEFEIKGKESSNIITARIITNKLENLG